MPLVAVAGGTSPTLGRSFVTALLNSKTHNPIILSRLDTSKQPQPPTKYGAAVRYVDYSSVESIAKALDDVETVISVINIPGPDFAPYHLNILAACEAAGVKRFAPSEYEAGPAADGMIDILSAKVDVWKGCEKSSVECARFSVGMFMQYFAIGGGDIAKSKGTEKGHEDASAGLVDNPLVWYVKNARAELPVKDDGSFPKITFTDIRDIGRFVAAACELPLGSWETDMGIVGETIALDKATEILEKATGKKFDITTVTAKDLRSREDAIEGIGANMEEIMGKLMDQMEQAWIKEEAGMAVINPVVNTKCPAVKPKSIEEFVKECYGQ